MTRHTMRVTVNQNYQYGHREQDHSDLIDEDGINWRYSGVHGDPSATHWDELEYESGVDFEFAIYGESNFGDALLYNDLNPHPGVVNVIVISTVFLSFLVSFSSYNSIVTLLLFS